MRPSHNGTAPTGGRMVSAARAVSCPSGPAPRCHPGWTSGRRASGYQHQQDDQHQPVRRPPRPAGPAPRRRRGRPGRVPLADMPAAIWIRPAGEEFRLARGNGRRTWLRGSCAQRAGWETLIGMCSASDNTPFRRGASKREVSVSACSMMPALRPTHARSAGVITVGTSAIRTLSSVARLTQFPQEGLSVREVEGTCKIANHVPSPRRSGP